MSYRVLRELGRGGMGAVYVGLHVELSRKVAIKFLTGMSATVDDPGADRFLREMKVLQGLSHPGIVRFLDAGVDDGRPFLVMELLDGADLLALIKRHGPLPVDVAFAVIEQVLDAAAYLHDQGLVHRDIKPANILVDRHGRAALGDFGLVKVENATVLTQEGQGLGTLLYVPPEVIEGHVATAAADVWACGTVLYEMLAGHPAFAAPTLAEACQNIVRSQPPALELLRTDVPPELCRVVDRLLEKDAAKRPDARAARELVEAAKLAPLVSQLASSGAVALAALAGGAPPDPSKPGPPPSVAERSLQGSLDKLPVARRRSAPPSRTHRRHVRRVAAVPFALAGLAVIAFALLRAPAADEPADVRARWTAVDRVEVTFRTAGRTRWELTGDGRTLAADEEPRGEHRLEGRAGFPRPPAVFELRNGAERRHVTMPAAPGARAEALVRLVRGARLDARTTDGLWRAIRASGLEAASANLEPAEARAALARKPDLLTPIRTLIQTEVARFREPFEDVRSFVAPLLSEDSTPPELRADLLDALGRLDGLDSVAAYLGLPVPFDVQAAMRPAVSVWGSDGHERPFPGAQVLPLFPPPGVSGALLFLEKEVPAAGSPTSGIVGDLVFRTKSRFTGRSLLGRAEFAGPARSGADSVSLAVRCSHLLPHMALLVDVPGIGAPLTVRYPNESLHATTRSGWLSIEVRGALARDGGTWALRQARAFLTAGQPYIVLDRVITPKP
jgi:serine/threonine protein kinase